MELRQLQTFTQIAQMQSFSRTAEMLGYSQSAVTVQIRQLENELGKRLFDRTGKKVVLTPQGEEFLEHANRILYDVHQAKASMNDTDELKHWDDRVSVYGEISKDHKEIQGTVSQGFYPDYGRFSGKADPDDGT